MRQATMCGSYNSIIRHIIYFEYCALIFYLYPPYRHIHVCFCGMLVRISVAPMEGIHELVGRQRGDDKGILKGGERRMAF